jgi:hypothetical protein
MFAGQDLGFKLQVIVTALVAVAVIWAGIQTGDWSGLVLVVPLAILIPITAKLPKEPPRRRQAGQAGKGSKAEDNEPKRY